MARLQDEPISADALAAEVRGDGDGAVALFLGTVRNENAGRRVQFLEYEAYPGMAEAEMERIEREAARRFGVTRLLLVHRAGRLEIGEASVGVAASSPHRTQALEACRFAIDELKKTVPIWKKEYFEGGAVWIEGAGESPSRGFDPRR
jgi:molybdopterin synthase catalytic subunit